MNPHISTRRRVARAGNLITEGPYSIRPPRAFDDYGWLEASLRLVHWRGGSVESAAVFVDASANREDGFLAPVVRHAVWAKGEDLKRAITGQITWPGVTVTLAIIKDRSAIDVLIREVQGCLAQIPLVPFGLSADRSVPEVPTDERGRIRVSCSNGVQTVEYETATSPSDGGLTNVALAGIAALRGIGPALNLEGWRESYPHSLVGEDSGESWWWHYQLPGAT